MKNKAQIAGQIFVYIIAIVIVALVIFFGWKSVKLLIDQSEEVSAISFQSDLKNSVGLLYSSTGSVRIEELNLPGKVTEVCFIDVNKDIGRGMCDPGSYGDLPKQYFIMCDSWQSGGLQNVFLVPQAKNPIFINNLIVNNDEGFECFEPIQGRIKIKLTSLGEGINVESI